MYMERIDTRTARRAKPKGLKLAAGALFLPVAALVWLPWLGVTAIWFVVAGLARAVAKTATTIRDTLLYAGELVVGR